MTIASYCTVLDCVHTASTRMTLTWLVFLLVLKCLLLPAAISASTAAVFAHHCLCTSALVLL
jgi:hypothetical protein